ncbi:MAG TPA: hypothetical protein PLA50_19545 [Bacteroidia bacterium]|nr:hypothetical protein [Bacteroidia bacterium]
MADRSQGILLNSSIIIAHFRGQIDLFQLVSPDEPLFVPLVALGELRKGALKSANPPKHQAKITALLKIAAVALELDMPLATRDAHFERIDGLTVIKW